MKIQNFFIRAIALIQVFGSGISLLWILMLTMPGTVPAESMLHKYGEATASWFYLKNIGSIAIILPLFIASVGIFFFKPWAWRLFVIVNSIWGVITIILFLFEFRERQFQYFVEDGLFIHIFFSVWYFVTAVYLWKQGNKFRIPH